MARPMAIDGWAHARASRIAQQTGWRASEVYAFIAMATARGDQHDVIDRALEILVGLRLAGESFDGVCRRLGTIIDQIEMEHRE